MCVYLDANINFQISNSDLPHLPQLILTQLKFASNLHWRQAAKSKKAQFNSK